MRISDWSSGVCSSDLDIGGARAHREARDQRTFDQLVRIVADDFAVLATARFGFVGVDDQEARAVFARLLWHEAPLQTGREARAAAAAQARRLDLLDDRVLAARSEERRVGKECVSTCGCRRWPDQ